jgi:1A family penicillin-binding protein
MVVKVDKMKRFKIIILSICSLGILAMFFYVSLYLFAYLAPKLNITSANSYYFYDDNEKLFTGNSTKDWISLDKISPNVINATLAVEDKHFYEHKGFDFPRIIKSIYTNIVNRNTLVGASTITQQYARNLFLNFDKKWKRKIDEAWLTIRLETHYKKDEILEGYLNTINYGGVFGIENAAQYYFNKSAENLNLAEATILVGIPKSPSNYSPLENEEAAKNRQNVILEAMVKNGYITKEEKELTLETKLVYYGKASDKHLSTLMYYQDAVIDELKNINVLPNSFLETGGLKIYTNLNLDTQKSMEDNMETNITDEKLQIASVAVEPKTGKILALIGGRDYSKSQYNRAVQSKRQVGSAMKPILYYAALENGFTSSTTFKSSKTTFVFSEDERYSPQNFGDSYPNREISLATALAYSDNIYAVKTNLFLGEEVLVETAKKIGIKENLEAIPSLALGTEEINILEMMKAYSAFASGGLEVNPHLIERVEDMNGNVLYEYEYKEKQALNEAYVYILNELLSNTSSKNFITYAYPTCYNIAYKMSNKYAIKTGTTDTDLLVFGYNPDILVGIWAGYDDNEIVVADESSQIKNMWVDTVEAYLKDKETAWYEMPEDVIGTLADPVTGEVKNASGGVMLYYIKGTEPFLDKLNFEDVISELKE